MKVVGAIVRPNDAGRRYRNNEPPAGLTIVFLLAKYFASEVPAKQKDIIGTIREQSLRVNNGDALSGHEFSLLERVRVRDKVEESIAEIEEIQQCGAFRGCPIACDSPAILFLLCQERRERRFQFQDARGKVDVIVRAIDAQPLLFFPLAGQPLRSSGVAADEDPH